MSHSRSPRNCCRVCHLFLIFGKFKRKTAILDDLKERIGYSHLKEEALDRAMWRARFGRRFGPAVRQITK
jgi:hypothetical protein